MSGSNGSFEDLYKPSRRPSVRRARYSGEHTFSIYANVPDIESMVDELNDQVVAAARPAAQAAAEVLYQAVLRNVATLGQKTGNLYNAIYQAYAPESSSVGRAVYHISWRTGGAGVRAPHGHLIEFGHFQRYKAYIGSDGNWYTNLNAPLDTPVQIPAHPFIRPASAYFPQAIEAAQAKLLEAVA